MTAPEDQNGLREALARWIETRFPLSLWQAEAHAQAMVSASGPLASLIAERDADRTSLRAAEAEITRLKEGMEGRERANDRLTEMVEKLVLNATTGSVPRAIIVAAGDLLDTLSQEYPHG